MKILMYHYVKDYEKELKFKKLKGIDINDFNSGVDELARKFEIICPNTFIEYLKSGKTLSNNCCLLTFDDGYKEHFSLVFDSLCARGIKAFFFPIAYSINEKKISIVNMIHYIIASDLMRNYSDILISKLIKYNFSQKEISDLVDRNFIPNKYDDPDINFFKRTLQREIDSYISNLICEEILREIIDCDLDDFSEALYMNASELIEMHKFGNYIGSHSYSHTWLNYQNKFLQEIDIKKSILYLRDLGIYRSDSPIFCYPYGGFNDDTIDILKNNDFIGAFGVNAKDFDVIEDDKCKFNINRYDINDLEFILKGD